MSKFTIKTEHIPDGWTEDDVHIDFIKTNLHNCESIIFDAEICNKGIYAHDINSALHKLKYVVKEIKTKNPIDVSKEKMIEGCKIMQHISSRLWLANRK